MAQDILAIFFFSMAALALFFRYYSLPKAYKKNKGIFAKQYSKIHNFRAWIVIIGSLFLGFYIAC
jgi:mannose/fructose/N-acetylgalactosamine-specific phosphotransferase system component IID